MTDSIDIMNADIKRMQWSYNEIIFQSGKITVYS
jgi:hypothetical protein